MHSIDWILVVVPIVVVVAVAIYTRRYVKSVADFLAGGRCAGRYLLANARGESDSGLANTSARFEIILVSGFVLNFWEKVSTPIILLVGISGFVVYRFRETRAMTLAQFLEMRYSRRYRFFMGALAFLSGILNYGIFPAVSARFFIYFLDLPHSFSLGPVTVSTFAAIMFAYLSSCVAMLFLGGQVTMMITDCIEGIFSHLIYIIIAVVVFYIVSWTQVMEVMAASEPGHSLINPFDTSKVPDFNIWFVAMAVANRIYTTMASQNKQGFNAAARTAHESRMGGILGEWRGYARNLMLLVLGICAVTFMRHPAFAADAMPIHQQIAAVDADYLKDQMTVPIALSHLLPVGIKGLFVAIMIMGLVAGDSGHLHSWGSIFVQDVVLPLKKKAMSPRQHIWALRLAVMGVAGFALFFSTFWTQTQFINLWWLITGGIFTGGAGAAIIGGLYWKKGTTTAAWAATLTGSILSFVGMILGSFWPGIRGVFGPAFASLGMTLPEKFWFNFQVSGFIAAIAAVLVYVICSLLTSRTPFNLDRMLHRGKYAVEAKSDKEPDVQETIRERFRLRNLLHFDSNFTFTDKLVAGGIFWWSMLLVAVNVVVSVWNVFFFEWPLDWWAHYWMVTGIAVPLLIAAATLVWFGIGGFVDMKAFFHALRTQRRDERDDGRVVQGHNLADETPRTAGEPPLVADAKTKPTATAVADPS